MYLMCWFKLMKLVKKFPDFYELKFYYRVHRGQQMF